MFDRLLVTTDGSAFAEQSTDAAIALARKCGAEVRCVTVVEHPPAFGTPEAAALYDADLYRNLAAELEKLGQEAVDRIADKARAAGLQASTAVRHGIAADEIVAEAESWPADIIVLSTHGRTGLARLVLGSVANQVVHRAHCPVLLLRPSEPE